MNSQPSGPQPDVLPHAPHPALLLPSMFIAPTVAVLLVHMVRELICSQEQFYRPSQPPRSLAHRTTDLLFSPLNKLMMKTFSPVPLLTDSTVHPAIRSLIFLSSFSSTFTFPPKSPWLESNQLLSLQMGNCLYASQIGDGFPSKFAKLITVSALPLSYRGSDPYRYRSGVSRLRT